MDELDYGSYSLDDLYDAQRNIDRNLYPERARRLDELIQRREAEPVRQEAPAKESKTPTRTRKPSMVTVVGIIAIIFGLSGSQSHIGLLVYPWTVFEQQKAYERMEMLEEEMRDDEAEQKAPVFWEFWDAMKQLTDPPAWYNRYCYGAGSIGLMAVGAYIVGGVLLIRRRIFGVRLLIAASVVSLLLRVLGVAIMHFSFGFPLLMILPLTIFTCGLDAAVLVATLVVRRVSADAWDDGVAA
jgi:hypothetical protein